MAAHTLKQEEIRKDVQNLKKEVDEKTKDIKKEIGKDVSNLKESVKADVSNLKESVKVDVGNLKESVKVDVGNLKEKLQEVKVLQKQIIEAKNPEVTSTDIGLSAGLLIAALILSMLLKKFFKERDGQQRGKMRARAAFFLPLFLWVATFILILLTLHVSLDSMTNVLIASGIVIGLIVTPAGNNVIAGIVNALNDSYRVGETIEVDGHLGVVAQRGIMTTEIHSNDGVYIDIPNKILFDHVVQNYTRIPFYRFMTPVYLKERAPVDDVLNVLNRVLSTGKWNIEFQNDDYKQAYCHVAPDEDHAQVFHVYGYVQKRLEASKEIHELNLEIRRAFEQAKMT